MSHYPSSRQRLVAKPDQLIKRRGKLGLVKVNSDLRGLREWLGNRMGEEVSVGAARGKLTNFIVERFVPHEPAEEHYLWYVVHDQLCTAVFIMYMYLFVCSVHALPCLV